MPHFPCHHQPCRPRATLRSPGITSYPLCQAGLCRVFHDPTKLCALAGGHSPEGLSEVGRTLDILSCVLKQCVLCFLFKKQQNMFCEKKCVKLCISSCVTNKKPHNTSHLVCCVSDTEFLLIRYRY